VGAALAPPLHVQWRHAVHEFPRVVLAQEEVIVIELNSIHTIALRQMAEDSFRALRSLHLLPASGKIYDATEVAVEGTADAGLMHRRAPAEKCREQILLHRKTMIGQPGKHIRSFHGPLGIVPRSPVGAFVF